MALREISTGGGKKYNDERFEFEEKGQTLAGYLLEKATLKSKEGKSFQKYLVKTSSGSILSTLGSHQLDRALNEVSTGSYVEITYNGKKKLDGGRTVKQFTVRADDENRVA